MPNDHKEQKEKIENRFSEENVLWGDEVADVGIVAAGVSAYFGISAGYEYFEEKLDKLKQFGIEAVDFLARKGNPNDYNLYLDTIKIDHWETVNLGPLGGKRRVYTKRSYRYYMAIRKK